jgi:folate-binding protein YgfZ
VSASGERNVAAPAQLGDPLGEQRELLAGRALTVLPARGVIWFEGPDASEFLSRMLSRTPDPAAGASCESLVLDPNGHVRFAVQVVSAGTGYWLLVTPGLTESLMSWAESMRFRLRFEVRDRSDDFREVAWFGHPAWCPALRPEGVWRDPWGSEPQGSWRSAPAGAADAEGWTLQVGLLPVSGLSDALGRAEAVGASRAGWAALNALRLGVARPCQDTEGDPRLLPHEVDWLRTAVQLGKGCYPGQETVSKVHNLGHPPRRLTLLQLDGAPDIARGASVRLGAQEVGQVTSAAVHWELGPIALALLRRCTPVGAQLLVEDGDRWVSAAQEVVVPPDAGGAARGSVGALRSARQVRGSRRRPLH